MQAAAARCSRVAAFRPAVSGRVPGAAPVCGAHRTLCVALAQQEQQEQQQQQQPANQQQQQAQTLARGAAAAGASVAGLLATAAAAWAVDEEPTYNYPATDDPVVTVLFTLAIGLLSTVTLGVVYLGVLSWLDSRQEKKDQEGSPFSKALASEGAAAEAERERKRVRRVVDKSKGFGQ